MKIGTRTLITFEAAADWRAEREAASTALPRKPALSASRPPNENGCPAGTGQPKSSAFDVAHQNSQFAVRVPVAARSRLGAARRYRLRSPLGVARLIPKTRFRSGCRVVSHAACTSGGAMKVIPGDGTSTDDEELVSVAEMYDPQLAMS